jgi:hypothetical protein
LCAFANAHSPDTTFTCTDDGTFTVTLTASDGVNAPVSDSAMVTVANAPPSLGLTSPVPWQLFRAGTPVTLTAPFTDPGANDTHTCSIDWDDGAVQTFAADATCAGTHAFPHPGMFTVGVTVSDDDGGTDTDRVLVIAFDPYVGSATGNGWIESPAGAYVPDPAATGKAHLNSNPKYHKDAVVPSGRVSFDLETAGLDLSTDQLQWLVVTPDGKFAVKGTGTTGVGFVVYGIDGSEGPDRLRVLVWPLSAGPIPDATVLYDNVPDADFDIDRFTGQELGGGSIQIHAH